MCSPDTDPACIGEGKVLAASGLGWEGRGGKEWILAAAAHIGILSLFFLAQHTSCFSLDIHQKKELVKT